MNNLRNTYHAFPRAFWTLMMATFIDRLGGALLFPFFALYITDRFEVGMTEVGVMFIIFSVTSVAGALVAGALTDRFGRKRMLLLGLVISATSSLLMGMVDDLNAFYVLVVFVGLLSNLGGPAQQAMVADLLPGKQQAEGFGIWRVVANLSVTIGPALGGLLAAYSFFYLFVADAISSIIMAIIVFVALPETMPERAEDHQEESMAQTMGGYSHVLRDVFFISFAVVVLLMNTTYSQMNSTLSVYLRDIHGVSVQNFGWLLSMNAAMVVMFQFWVTRRVKRLPAMQVMAAGTFLYAVGFAMYGFVGSYAYFVLAMIIITIGEMMVAPVSQALVGRMAPANMRGRYMAIFGFTGAISFAIGPYSAGLVMDNLNPDWVWYGSGLLGLLAVAGYLSLAAPARRRIAAMEAAEEAAGEAAGEAAATTG